MKARLKSGAFQQRYPTRMYYKGDVIDDIEKVPVAFRDRWEVIPPRKRREVPAPVVKKEIVVKEKPVVKAEPKKKTTRKALPAAKKTTTYKPRTTTKKTGSKRTTPKKK